MRRGTDAPPPKCIFPPFGGCQDLGDTHPPSIATSALDFVPVDQQQGPAGTPSHPRPSAGTPYIILPPPAVTPPVMPITSRRLVTRLLLVFQGVFWSYI